MTQLEHEILRDFDNANDFASINYAEMRFTLLELRKSYGDLHQDLILNNACHCQEEAIQCI